MRQSLKDLADLTDAVFRGRVAILQQLAAEEAKIRQTLSNLENARNTVSLESSVDAEMRALGADLLWQGWVTRQQMEQNIHLANLLVRKDAIRRELQASFGRAQVAGALLAAAESAARRTKLRRE